MYRKKGNCIDLMYHNNSYGGYDGYHVYNDVAVLDTRTWTWTIKNTNAAVQGRADVSTPFISFPTNTKTHEGGASMIY